MLQPGGTFAMVDFHAPQKLLLWPMLWLGLAIFLWLFETETAWELLRTDVAAELEATGFKVTRLDLHAGGSLQVIQAQKPMTAE